MRGSRERGLNLIICFMLCHVSADGLVLAGFVLSPSQLPAGPRLRLVPGDESGVKTVVMHVRDVEQVARVLVAAGAKVLSFPGYHAVQVRTYLLPC